MQIKDLKAKEDTTLTVMIKSVQSLRTAAQKPYLKFEFVDKSGSIFANKWSVKPSELEAFSAGQIVTVKGLVQLYNAQKQWNIESISVVEGDVDPADYVESSSMTVESLKEYMGQFMGQMQEGYYKEILQYFLDKYEQEFYVHPAASRMHHAFRSGLAQHVFEMLKMGEAYCELYPIVNRDLLYAGIILHDLGKLFEMSYEKCVKTEYTLEGLMVGHINMMVSMIDEASRELGYQGEEVLFLKHMVIAHHGKLEWGSPKEPMIIEAELLHYLDVVSAKMTAATMALQHCAAGEMSDRIPMLDNRRFYHHK
ncbi:3'-5' exoribonuclease YhaM [Turicibacter faecis]|uniref:3'-5' exoribonuclease YhaM n=1 Tax=Turicibacter faecis TaxID=2963365 RepID=A0ABN6Z9I7_9FIRM|nr:3'-5' exoribonuclease YhaM [Turicibacter sp. TC023]